MTKAKKVVDKIELSLEQMSKEDRYIFIKDNLGKDPRTKAIFETLSEDEIEVFKTEYLRILKNTDSLNEAEEQQLFMACIEIVLAIRSLQLKSDEEQLFKDSKNGKILPIDSMGNTNPLFRGAPDTRYAKEYKDHMDAYNKMIRELKLSRDQRLDQIKAEKKTFLDVVMDYNTASSKSVIADEVSRLSKESDEELKRLLAKGFILGVFEND